MQGEILHFVEALGSNESDEKFVELLGLIGADDIERDQSLASPEKSFLIASNVGIEMVLVSGSLNTIFVKIQPEESFTPYARVSELIVGVSPDMSKDDVVAALGEPTSSFSVGVAYAVADGYVQLEFKEGVLSSIAVFARD